jgi:hypothetical protein
MGGCSSCKMVIYLALVDKLRKEKTGRPKWQEGSNSALANEVSAVAMEYAMLQQKGNFSIWYSQLSVTWSHWKLSELSASCWGFMHFTKSWLSFQQVTECWVNGWHAAVNNFKIECTQFFMLSIYTIANQSVAVEKQWADPTSDCPACYLGMAALCIGHLLVFKLHKSTFCLQERHNKCHQSIIYPSLFSLLASHNLIELRHYN